MPGRREANAGRTKVVVSRSNILIYKLETGGWELEAGVQRLELRVAGPFRAMGRSASKLAGPPRKRRADC